MSAMSLLGFMDAVLTEDENKADQERQRMYIEYLMMVNARSPQSKDEKKAQEKFAKELKPKEFNQQKRGPAKVYKWDGELMNRLKSEQQKRLNM